MKIFLHHSSSTFFKFSSSLLLEYDHRSIVLTKTTIRHNKSISYKKCRKNCKLKIRKKYSGLFHLLFSFFQLTTFKNWLTPYLTVSNRATFVS